jgi:hypothetical protein
MKSPYSLMLPQLQELKVALGAQVVLYNVFTQMHLVKIDNSLPN